MPLPILIYHQIAPCKRDAPEVGIAPEDWPYRLDKEVFEAQLRWTFQEQIRTQVIEEVTGASNAAAPLSPGDGRSVCLTFDDGSVSDYTVAFPTLLSYGQRATFFVITECIGQRGYVSWNQLREMAAHGMSIQSHSCTHSSLPHIATRKAWEELWRSKECLEQRLGCRIAAFAAPGGDWQPHLSILAKACGYQIVCTSSQGVNYEPFDLLAMRRLSVRRTYSDRRFRSLVLAHPSVVFRQRLEAFCLESAKTLLGWKRYNTIRNRILARRASSATTTS